MTNISSEEFAALAARMARIEARDACLSAFHEYLHYLDGGFLEDLLQVYAPDAELKVIDFPPGSGEDLIFKGRDEIRTLFAAHSAGIGRHHSANTTVNVAPDLQSAELSAYFITSSAYAFGGGVYQATLCPGEERWQLKTMRIVSTWGWELPSETPPFLSNLLGKGALRDGKPIVYRP